MSQYLSNLPMTIVHLEEQLNESESNADKSKRVTAQLECMFSHHRSDYNACLIAHKQTLIMYAIPEL